MNDPPGVTGIAVVVFAVVFLSAIEIVDAYEKRALTVRGEYRSLLSPGVNVVVPFVSETHRIDMRTQRAEIAVETTTRDWGSISATAVVDLAVADAETAFLETDEYLQDAQDQAQTALREFLGDLGFDVTNVDIEELTVEEDGDW